MPKNGVRIVCKRGGIDILDELKLEGIFSKGYGIIPKLVMKDKNLTVEAKSIYAYICSYAGGGDTAFPSVDLICSDLGMSENRFFKHRKLLVESGYLTIKRTRKEVGWSNNIYTICHTVHLQIEGIRNEGIGIEGIRNEGTNNNSFNNNNLNNNNKKIKNVNQDSLVDDFEKLWKLHPNKKGNKNTALKAYKKALKSGTTNKQIQDGIVAYKKHLAENDWLKPAYASTWFFNERWNDEYENNVTADKPETKKAKTLADDSDYFEYMRMQEAQNQL